MAKLPFIVEPRLKPVEETIGTEESGQIKVLRRGYLTAAEKAFTQGQEQTDSTQTLIRICRKIGTEEKMDMPKAYQIVSDCIQGLADTKDHKKVAEKYEQELAQVTAELSSASARKELMEAVCILLYRVDPEFDLADIGELHPDLIEGLVGLYRDEEARSTERLEQALNTNVDMSEVDTIAELEKK